MSGIPEILCVMHLCDYKIGGFVLGVKGYFF